MATSANRVLVVSIVVVSLATLVSAQGYRQLSTVHDGSGTMSSGGTYTNWSAAGQPGGIAVSSNGALTHYAGFLQAVDIKRPNLDTDGDGVIDEISTDNDGDNLTDTAEVQGSSFTPPTATDVNIADSDGDGTTDGGEAIAETDPTDENINLQILDIRDVGGNREVSYMARQGKTYHIRSTDGSYQQPATDLGSQQEPAGGSGTWLVRTNVYTDAGATTQRSYAVEAQR